jgi:hypothetical protein
VLLKNLPTFLLGVVQNFFGAFFTGVKIMTDEKM